MTEQQVSAIRYILDEAFNDRMGADETARYIRPIIGLNEQQTVANLRFYNHAKEVLAEEHPRMKPETIDRKAREQAARYASKQHRYRADTIARTELITAYHEGNDRAVRECIQNGYFPKMKKVWSTSLDAKVCPACRALEGVELDMDEEFSTKSGRKTVTTSIPPLHPRCACAVKYVESSEKDGIMKLPRYEEAVISEAKFSQYALNPDRDANKARAFKEALGYDMSNYNDLIESIRDNLPKFEAREKGDNGYGMRYEVKMNLSGPNGKTANVITAWINDSEKKETRLTSVYVDKE